MPIFRRIILLLALLPTLFLSSCLDGDEEYWINADASGRVHLDYKIPPLVLDQLGDYNALFAAVREIDELEPSLTLNTLSAKREAGKVRFILDAKFTDARELFSLTEKHREIFQKHLGADDSRFKAALGTLSLKREGLQLHLRRELDFATLFPDMIKRNPAILGGSTFTYTIHLPTPASQSNARETSTDKKTLTWRAKLKEHTTTPIILDLHAPIPFPTWLKIAAVCLILILLFLAIIIWKKHKKSAHH